MTVREMIKILKTLPQDATVYHSDCTDGELEVIDVYTTKMYNTVVIEFEKN